MVGMGVKYCEELVERNQVCHNFTFRRAGLVGCDIGQRTSIVIWDSSICKG